MINNLLIPRVLKKTLMALFQVLPWHLLEGTEENHDEPYSVKPVAE
jgi:hypothetical protein